MDATERLLDAIQAYIEYNDEFDSKRKLIQEVKDALDVYVDQRVTQRLEANEAAGT